MLPDSISSHNVDQVQEAATAISGWDNKFGGGGMVGDVADHAMQWAAGLLNAKCPETLWSDLLAAVSRLGIVVSTSAFDSYNHFSVKFILLSKGSGETTRSHI
ncbi:hypothetical protein [Streptomyces hirsutus]|uniref:hypothetical protein n=1 Tax=Streptomyces hirsutus TaxID=35620 RepID=UPI0006E1A41C|nr:hypothetical protein [Streptomyces hirsutus]